MQASPKPAVVDPGPDQMGPPTRCSESRARGERGLG